MRVLLRLALLLGMCAAFGGVALAQTSAQPGAQQTPAPNAQLTVGDIQFRGLLSWKPDELSDRLSLKVGQPYDQLMERDDLTQLSRIMRRVNVLREPMPNNQIRLTYVVEEFPRLRNIQIIGNKAVSEERIHVLTPLKPGDVLDNNALEALRRALRGEYEKMGLTSAKVDVNVSIVLPREMGAGAAKEFAQADLQIVIDEGERIKIDDMNIEGNQSFSTLHLKLLLESKGSFLFVKNYYDNTAFENDLVKLRSFYTANGFFDVLVERGTFVERREKKGLVITPVIKIQEGQKYKLGAIDVRGARLFSRAEILEPFRPLVGQDFSAKTFGRALEQVQGLYLDNGFLTTEIKPNYDYNAESTTMNATLEVTEKNRIYVGDIKVNRPKYKEGEAPGFFQRFYERIAPPISDEAIKREVLLEPGEVYSKRKERDTVRRLQQMGVFKDVTAANQPTENPRIHDVYLNIEEGVTGEFSTGIGYGDISGGFIYANLNERNLFGEAKDLRLVVQVGTQASNATLTYTDRHFRDTSDVFTSSIFYNQYLREAWQENIGGVNAEIARQFYGDWEGGLRGRLEYVSTSGRKGRNPQEDIDVAYPVVTARVRYSQDSRYPRDQPTEGRRIEGSVEAGYAGGPLLKFVGNGDYVYQLSPNFTYHLSPTIGVIPYNSESVGLTERFYMGGSDDLRGFKVQGAGRRDPKDDRVPIGGAVKILTRNEIGFPIFDPVGGVFFVDAGMLGKNPFSYELPRVSTGFGVRLAMPMAGTKTNIAVDFALPVIHQSGDELQFIHFSFKSAF